MISSQANHESETPWSPHTADHTQVPVLHGGKAGFAVAVLYLSLRRLMRNEL